MSAAAVEEAAAGQPALPLYGQEPRLLVRQEALERCALERLELLQALEPGVAPAASAAAGAALQRLDPEADRVGHFVLRLALCATHALREWLVGREAALLAHRWAGLAEAERDRALASLGVARAEPAPGLPRYQLPFTELPPRLLAERRVVLRRGVAYVSEGEAGALASHRFEARLREALLWAARAVEDAARGPQLEGLRPLLDRLRQRGEELLTVYPAGACGSGAGTGSGDDIGLSLGNFEEMLRESFPPCMRHLVIHQRTGRRLRFLGRLQLRPFLRKAGLALPGALQWWERELMRDLEVTREGFDRKHRYHVEHAHGARGHGREAHPFGCARIQGFPAPQAEQAHGCPFQRGHEGGYALPALLDHWGLASQDADSVLHAAREGSPAGACAAFFRAAHPWAPEELCGEARHPNEYARRSRLAMAARHQGALAVQVKPAPAEPATTPKSFAALAPPPPRQPPTPAELVVTAKATAQAASSFPRPRSSPVMVATGSFPF